MKVYGGYFFYKGKQVRGIFAGTQKQVAIATHLSLNYIQKYWCVTSNKKEIEIALKNPGVLFWCNNNYYINDIMKLILLNEIIISWR